MLIDIKHQISEMLTNVADVIRSRWNFHQHAAYLKKRGWSEDQFQYIEDPDRNQRANAVKDYYFGYPRVYVWHNSNGLPWSQYNGWSECYKAMNIWCKENCKAKWRQDILRTSRQISWQRQSDDTLLQTHTDEWVLDDLGGGDCLFYAFKSNKDYVNFLLKWC